MALSWEVGSFLPIGGGSFMLFTLTEHLMFAAQALPATLVIASLFVVPFAFNKPIDSITDKTLRRIEGPAIPPGAGPAAVLAILKIQISRLRRWMIVLRMISLGFGMLIIYWGFHIRLAAIMVFGIGVAGAALLRESPPERSRQLPFFCWLLIASLGMAMAFGSDYSRLVLNNDRNIVDLKIRQVAKRAVLVRSGERGVLLFEPQTQRFSVEKWDAVEGLDWERAPLFKMLFKESKG